MLRDEHPILGLSSGAHADTLGMVRALGPFLSEALEQFPEEKVPQGKLGRPLPYFPKPKERFSTDMLEGQKEGPRVVWPCLRGQSILFLSHLPQLSIHSRSQQSGESSRLLYLLDLYAEKFS